jgi:hypothetical protein
LRGLRGGEWLFLIPAVATIGLTFLEEPVVVGAVLLVVFTGLAALALQDRMGKHQKTTGRTGLQVVQAAHRDILVEHPAFSPESCSTSQTFPRTPRPPATASSTDQPAGAASESEELVRRILRAQQNKDPQLAAKQRRLLQALQHPARSHGDSGPTNPQLEVVQLASQYSKRFGHGVPMATYELQEMPTSQIVQKLQEALATGNPVAGWDKMAQWDFEPKPVPTQAQAPTQTDDEMQDAKSLEQHNQVGALRGKPR